MPRETSNNKLTYNQQIKKINILITNGADLNIKNNKKMTGLIEKINYLFY